MVKISSFALILYLKKDPIKKRSSRRHLAFFICSFSTNSDLFDLKQSPHFVSLSLLLIIKPEELFGKPTV